MTAGAVLGEQPKPMILDPSITCGRCSETSQIDQWKGAPGAELPANRFECPKCSCAFERRAVIYHGEHRLALVPVDSELPLAGGGAR